MGNNSVGKNKKKLEPSYTISENVKWAHPLWKTILWFLNKPNKNHWSSQEVQSWEYTPQENKKQKYTY